MSGIIPADKCFYLDTPATWALTIFKETLTRLRYFSVQIDAILSNTGVSSLFCRAASDPSRALFRNRADLVGPAAAPMGRRRRSLPSFALVKWMSL
ncbi:hypothetical protein [Actinomadura sp. RB99]|uniref:hypothetical protein n=1 Tax=Actinomadura sp. RB99 TaxID=2691577 RepID=UPI001687B20E|nr:hypothetical protein [Actinomadura sp. RB99]